MGKILSFIFRVPEVRITFNGEFYYVYKLTIFGYIYEKLYRTKLEALKGKENLLKHGICEDIIEE